MPEKIDISVVIVNYNVKEFLANLLSSIDKARGNLRLEIFVVDNASTDGSIPFLKSKYPDVTYIENEENLGFGVANNVAISQATGTYTLIINPDVIISEDTLEVMFNHLESNPDAGAAGCKLLNPEGTFAPESRRTVPTLFSSICKTVGLSSLFPKSKLFAGYYMNWLDEDEPSQVPVLSGAFMFFRTPLLKELGGFDERFFMYAEDIDLSHRLNEMGYHIDYVPQTSIVHYKGESTKKDNLKYTYRFNIALFKFYQKHYSSAYSYVFQVVILLAVVLRGLFAYTKTVVKRLTRPTTDLLIMNGVLAAGFVLRYGIGFDDVDREYRLAYLGLHVLETAYFLLSAKYFELYGRNRLSAAAIVKVLSTTIAATAFTTFFIRAFAFSRLILVVAGLATMIGLVLLRIVQKNRKRSGRLDTGKIRPVRVLLIGADDSTPMLLSKLRSKINLNLSVVGIAAQNEYSGNESVDEVPVLGKLDEVPFMVNFHKIDQLVFAADAVPYKEIIRVLSNVRNQNVLFKIVPGTHDYIVGKSDIDYLEVLPAVELSLRYRRPWNTFVKRVFDLAISAAGLLILFLPYAIAYIFRSGKKKELVLEDGDSPTIRLTLRLPFSQNSFLNLFTLLGHVFRGELSLVGAPVASGDRTFRFTYKRGITGLRQINLKRARNEQERENFELHYMQNYSVWLDLDILLKSAMSPKLFLESLKELG